MAIKNGLLSDLQLRHWTKEAQPLAKSDGGGLTFTVSANGYATWILRYRHGGRRYELTLGRYPDIGLSEARTTAAIKRADVLKGANPAAEKVKAKAAAVKDMTVRTLIQDYKQKKLVTLARSTQVCYTRHLKRVEHRLGSLGVRAVEPGDVVSLIEDAALTWGESNLLLVTTKCLFTHACGKRLINVNPCVGIMLSALLGPRPPIRKRLMLTREELHLLLNAEMRRPNALAIRVLLGTGVRGAELYMAKWQDVHLDDSRWHIPASKTGAAMDIPLAPIVVRWFKELRAYAHRSAYVLPARIRSRAQRNGGDMHVGEDTIRESIDYWINQYHPPTRRFTPHDLRSTMKSHMRALGVPRDISEMCLNHKLTGVEGIYDQHNYFAERRQALLTWATFLETCEAGAKSAPSEEPEVVS
jgi:integrase